MDGDAVRRARSALGMSQEALAQQVGVSQPLVSQWERGVQAVSPVMCQRIKELRDTATESDSEIGGAGYGEWLLRARVSAGLSRAELSVLARISVPQIWNIETGRTRNPQRATRERLEGALKVQPPEGLSPEAADDAGLAAVGELTDFDPHNVEFYPEVGGVYVFYDISDRPIYVGRSASISRRVKQHRDKFWFRAPVVNNAAYVQIEDQILRAQVEKALIKFLKTNAVINQMGVERSDDDCPPGPSAP